MSAKQVAKYTEALGLDVDGHIVLTHISSVGQAFACRDLMVLRADDPSSYLVEFERQVREHGWRGKPVAISIPTEHVILRRMTLPAMSNKALRSTIHGVIENRLQLSISEPMFDFCILPRGLSSNAKRPDGTGSSWLRRAVRWRRHEHLTHNEIDVLVAIAPRSEVMRWSQFAEQAGLRPVAAEPGLVAVARTLDFRIQNALSGDLHEDGMDSVQIVVVVGAFGLDFGLIEGEIVTFIRHIELTNPRFATTTATRGLSQSEDSGEHVNAYVMEATFEIERSLSFVQYNVLTADQQINGVWIIDKLQLGNELADALQARVDVPVRMARYRFQMDSALQIDPSAAGATRHLTAVANGLAMGVMA